MIQNMKKNMDENWFTHDVYEIKKIFYIDFLMTLLCVLKKITVNMSTTRSTGLFLRGYFTSIFTMHRTGLSVSVFNSTTNSHVLSSTGRYG